MLSAWRGNRRFLFYNPCSSQPHDHLASFHHLTAYLLPPQLGEVKACVARGTALPLPRAAQFILYQAFCVRLDIPLTLGIIGASQSGRTSAEPSSRLPSQRAAGRCEAAGNRRNPLRRPLGPVPPA